ncbi:hypothetical protein CISG_06566 [Coccidioides immitis RMSCC 3703]|uniref:Uncharacterized protein n=1 Tax=Coccidioides immitis RMSCC 3703 TaxID=454286 RepID=A0A0J8R1W5_COCIT|nr:hypothetical protein CISG_06566 [Coccidioides immitis RMSCC 3703]
MNTYHHGTRPCLAQHPSRENRIVMVKSMSFKAAVPALASVPLLAGVRRANRQCAEGAVEPHKPFLIRLSPEWANYVDRVLNRIWIALQAGISRCVGGGFELADNRTGHGIEHRSRTD